MEITIDFIREEVGRGNLEKSIEMLLNYVSTDNEDSKNEVYLQSSRLQRALRSKRLGVISDESTSLVINQVTLGILEILDKLKKSKKVFNKITFDVNVNQLKLHLVNDDIINSTSDVLIMKHAQGMYGADLSIYNRLLKNENEISVEKNDYITFTVDGFYPKIIFYGVNNLWDFGYQQIASFTKDSLRLISEKFRNTSSVTYTLHGIGYGLDEYEALKFQILGLHDYLSNFRGNNLIKDVYIYEIDGGRFLRMKEYLNKIVPLFGSSVSTNNIWTFELLNNVEQQQEDTNAIKWGWFQDIGKHLNNTLGDFNNQKRVLVSIPFEDGYEDVYTLGILDVTRKMDFVTERINVRNIDPQSVSKFISLLRRCSIFIADVSVMEPIQLLQISFAQLEKKKVLLIYKGEKEFEQSLKRIPKIGYKTITNFKVDFEQLVKNYYMTFSKRK